MRELVIGDLHFGIKNNSLTWLEQQLNFITNQVFPILENENIDRCIFLGDLTDIRYSINQQVGIELKKLFRTMLNNYPNITFIICAGNHDYYSPLEEFASYNNSYELIFGEEFLLVHKNLIIVNQDPYITEDGALFLPWYWTENDNHIDEILYNYDFNDEVKEIFCHTDLSQWPGARIAAFKGTPIYSGHIHFCYEDTMANLFNLGSACAFTFNDANQSRYVYIINEKENKCVRIENVTTPKFIILRDEEIFDENPKYYNNNYVEFIISECNKNQLRYKEQITKLKLQYPSSNIRVKIVTDSTLFCTNNGININTNIEQYIENNIPDNLKDNLNIIKEELSQNNK